MVGTSWRTPWASTAARHQARYVATTDAEPGHAAYGGSVGEREDSWRIAVGAGTPAGPDTSAGGSEPPPAEVVQAVADFVADLVEDPVTDEDDE
jgi:hypothetical protein